METMPRNGSSMDELVGGLRFYNVSIDGLTWESSHGITIRLELSI